MKILLKEPKHFLWKLIHEKRLKALMITFPSFTFKDIMDKTLTNNFHNIDVETIQMYSHLHHTHYKNKVTKKFNSSKHQ